MPLAESEPATPASEQPQTLTVEGLGTVRMVTSNVSIEEINSISYTYRVTLSVYYHFYRQTLDTSLKRGPLVHAIHPNTVFRSYTPTSLMHKHSGLLHKGIRNSNSFLHTYKSPEGYKPTTKCHVIKLLGGRIRKFVMHMSNGKKSDNG
jgi:hypothetical protein